jgi:uncharacterized protein (TIGR02444 family)
MGAGHCHDPASTQHMSGKPLRPGTVVEPLLKRVLHRRIAPRHGIADNHQVRVRLQMAGTEALLQGDALRFQLCAHGGIDIGIGAADGVPQLFGEHGQAAHEGAADAKNVYVHFEFSCGSGPCPRSGPDCLKIVPAVTSGSTAPSEAPMSHASFWDFSLHIYRLPQVSETCLTLQNVHGFDVNVLLFACWYGRNTATCRQPCCRTHCSFRHNGPQEVVRPLRHARTWMKEALAQPHTLVSQMSAAGELREKIKAVELRSEQLQQQALERLARNDPATQSPASAEADTPDRHALAIAHNLQKVREASAVTLTPALAGLLQILQETATSA